MKTIAPGTTHVMNTVASPDTSAEKYGNMGFPVLATPALVGLFEKATIELLRDYLEADEGSVGTKVSIEHLAATPLGMKVSVTAKLATVDRKRLVFELEAKDEKRLIGRCSHERYLVNLPAFISKLDAV